MAKPTTADELRVHLLAVQGNFSKGTRRLADFLLANPGAVALLSSAEVAKRCDVHASSLVRLAQTLGLSGFRELQAILQSDVAARVDQAPPEPRAAPRERLRLRLLAESGRSFNQAAAEAADRYWVAHPEVEFHSELHVSHAISAEEMAHRIETVAEGADGLVLVAREHPAVNRAVQGVVARGVPVVCLTSDLPSSGRTAFVGSDQFASGSTAGWFCGRLMPRHPPGRVLFVGSVPFRCQLDREQGFRQVLRSEFPMLSIEEKVSSDESVEVVYDAIRRHIAMHGAPGAIYNVSGANLGIGRALEDEGLAGKVVFVGHELTANVRILLEKGVMDVTIGHDFDREIAGAVDCIAQARAGVQPASRLTPSLLYTRYNCL
ncbi:substrate-binding domain-containing protein [Stagnihabitans tardus]|uniref:Substrate-binding domain-containing protein n=1 Tax=Stagnihabitans tardus TaxID=2699202 RepID=A0AAE4YGI2_9RHOB|nr:substrate-binding domain-containing protein [Stagnihabitans tardus]NBZ89325.1 substrate-binding domain-containing protein [Stagnihabitans tardus]